MSKFGAARAGGDPGASPEGYPEVGRDESHYPVLVEFLTRTRFEDGSTRQTGTCLVLVEGGRLKVCCVDRQDRLVAFTSVESLAGLVSQLEEELAGQGLDWRPQRDGAGGRRR